MPADYPDYPHHALIAAYFDTYVDHFGLREKIRFQTSVQQAERAADSSWTLTLADGSVEHFDALVVANGHHWNPRWPEPAFPGSDTFEGVQMHAHSYVDNTDLAGKDVVVLGIGNSATDIAVESSYVAANTYLAARRGAWIVPKYMFGRPTDQLPNDPRVPFAIRRRVVHQLIKAYTGPPEKYGLPKPDHAFGQAHPTVSGRILDRIQHGRVTPKPNIDRLEGNDVVFVDGTRVHADVVVYCTGYKITFPFFDEDLISAPDNHIELFRRVFHPDIPNVAFVGLLQPSARDAALRGAGRLDRRLPHRGYALPSGRHGRGHRRRPGRDAQALRVLQAPHDPGRLRRLPRRPGRRAGARRRAPRCGYALPVTHHAAAAPRGGVSTTEIPAAPGPRASARRPRRPIARRSSTRRVSCSPNRIRRASSATSCGRRVWRPARSTTTSPTRRRSCAPCWWRPPPRCGPAARVRAGGACGFLSVGLRMYFSFLVEDRATFELVRRNAGTIRTLFGEPVLAGGLDELTADLREGVARGALPPMDVDYAAAAMFGAGFEVGMLMLERDPPDVDGATAFVTALFVGGLPAAG